MAVTNRYHKLIIFLLGVSFLLETEAQSEAQSVPPTSAPEGEARPASTSTNPAAVALVFCVLACLGYCLYAASCKRTSTSTSRRGSEWRRRLSKKGRAKLGSLSWLSTQGRAAARRENYHLASKLFLSYQKLADEIGVPAHARELGRKYAQHYNHDFCEQAQEASAMCEEIHEGDRGGGGGGGASLLPRGPSEFCKNTIFQIEMRCIAHFRPWILIPA